MSLKMLNNNNFNNTWLFIKANNERNKKDKKCY